MKKQLIAFGIIVTLIAVAIGFYTISQKQQVFGDFPINSIDKAIAYAKTDPYVKDLLNNPPKPFWLDTDVKELIDIDAYFYETMDLWEVIFRPSYRFVDYDICYIVYFKSNGHVIYKGDRWVCKLLLIGTWIGEISNASCNKVTLNFYINGSMRINYTWLCHENQSEIIWNKYLLLPNETLWVYPEEEYWNFKISDDRKSLVIFGVPPDLVLTKIEDDVTNLTTITWEFFNGSLMYPLGNVLGFYEDGTTYGLDSGIATYEIKDGKLIISSNGSEYSYYYYFSSQFVEAFGDLSILTLVNVEQNHTVNYIEYVRE